MAALNPRTLKRVGIAIGVVVALLSLWIVFGRGTNDPEKKNSVVADTNGENAKSAGRPTRDASALLDEAFAVADSDLDRAVELFHAARQLSQEPIECLPQTIAGHRGPVQRILIDHDAQWLVTYADDPFLVARNLNGLGATKPPLLRLQGPSKMVHSASFIGDTRRISSAGQDGVGRIWDLPTDAGGTLADPTIMRVPHEAPVVGMAWSPKGSFAVLAFEDNHLAVCGAGSEGEVAKAFPVVATPRDVAFDPTGAWLICLNEDGSLHGYQEASLISETAPQPIVLTQGSDSVRTFAIAPGANNNPSLLAVGGEVGEVSLYVLGPTPRKENLVANAHALPAPQPIDSIAIVRAGTSHHVLSGAADGGIHYWCPGNDPVTIHMPIHAQAIAQVVCDGKGEWGAAASFDGTVSLIHLSKEDPKSLRFGPKSGEFHSVALDPHGRWLMAGDQDGNLWIWPLPLAKILTVTQDATAKST